MSALEELVAVCRAHDKARRVAQEAGDARAVAVFMARQAGIPLGDVARILGCARAAVPPLSRRGEQLVGDVYPARFRAAQKQGPVVAPAGPEGSRTMDPPGEGSRPADGPRGVLMGVSGSGGFGGGPEAGAPAPARPESSRQGSAVSPPESSPHVPCIRAGCTRQAAAGGRLCTPHSLA